VTKFMRRRSTTVAAVAAMLVGVLLLLASQVTIAAPARGLPQAQQAPTPTPLSIDELSAIQPGLGTVMIEYAHRMAALYFGAEAGNWDMAKYQLIEMREIQEVGETTRPARAQALKSFESSFLDPLEQTIASQNKTQFESAYNAAIEGCNSCHGSQTSADFPGSFKFVKVQVPKDTLDSVYSYSP
jgi:hypothetical protein